MRTVLFDLFYAQPLDGSKFHGGGEYMKRVFKELVVKYSESIKIVVFFNFDAFLDDWVKDLIREKGIETVSVKSLLEVRGIIDKYQIDVFYTGMPYHYRREMFPDSVYKIGTFHGMRAVECPHDQYEYKYMGTAKARAKERLRNLLKESRIGYEKNRRDGLKNYAECLGCFDRIITVSEHSKYSLMNFFPTIKSEDISVFYSPQKERTVSEIEYIGGGVKNLLLLGGNRWIKNTYRGILAIDGLYSKGHLTDVETTVLGGISTQIKRDIDNLERFHEFGYIADWALENLYKNSILIYPTLNEGFGYPPLEAMYYGSTCVVSAVCSLPEICEDAVYYVNPTDIGEIQNRILHAIDKPIPREKVLEQYHKVSEKQELDLQKLCEIIIEKA